MPPTAVIAAMVWPIDWASGDVGAQYTPTAGWAQAIQYRRDYLKETDWTGAAAAALGGDGSTAATTAALDSVPAIMIDPKGDITNLLLTFPDLLPADFKPWVNVDDARRKGMSVQEAERWLASNLAYEPGR